VLTAARKSSRKGETFRCQMSYELTAMKAGLLHPLARRKRRRSHPRQRQKPMAHTPDLAVERVRRAGGPMDRACYTCGCGYMFLAPVSTTVACPHCEAPQAW
jgi:hypothetical protein